jgi:hypothetical protein
VQKTTSFEAVNMANNSEINAYLQNQFTGQYKSHDSHLAGLNGALMNKTHRIIHLNFATHFTCEDTPEGIVNNGE